MKQFLIIPVLIPLLSVTAHAKSISDSEFRKQLYFSLSNRFFEGIRTERIITRNDADCIYIDSGELSIKPGIYTLPLNSTDKPVLYSSDNPAITVDENGVLTSDGTPAAANITITSGDVTIVHPVYATKQIKRLSLSQSELSLYADRPEPVTLSLSCEPADADMSMVDWYSGDEGIVYVDENGTVIPNGVGTTSIYAETPDGSVTAKCTVKVGLYDVSIRSVFITNAIDRLKIGSEYSLSAYVYPETVQDKTVHWSSSDNLVCTIDQDGVIRGINTGTAVITAQAANGVMDTFEIEVASSSGGSFKYNVISKSVSERIAELQSKPQFIQYGYTLSDMVDFQMSVEPVKYSENRKAQIAETENEIDPASHASGYGKYQFIDLSQSNSIDVDTLNRYLTGKGVLEGKGQQFKDAADAYGLSELYLVTHACLESGDGMSQLARGVDVNGTVVYNMFGIGAYDAGAVLYGSQYAYSMGWTTVDAAIDGGARWISENYINNPDYRQNTLYKMRWNPDSPGTHQYATDIEWASAQAKMLKSMFDAFPNADLHYEIPLYKGEKEFGLK
ncbi:MAG: Ig-like domain-containing protein [Candidatus Ornithomonoglobus sp.]